MMFWTSGPLAGDTERGLEIRTTERRTTKAIANDCFAGTWENIYRIAKKCGSWIGGPGRPVVIRTLDRFPRGYANLAAFQTSDEHFAVYRRFDYLQSRLLLDKQDQLRILENELDALDDGDSMRHTRLELTPEEFEPRQALLDKIEAVIVSYCNMLQSGQNLLAGNRPTKRELSSVFNYLDDVKPVTIPEREYIKHEEDLVTLCPGVDDSLLQQWIEACLHVIQGRVKLAHHIFASKITRTLANRPGQYYYTRERIDMCAYLIVLVMIIATLIGPIVLLFGTGGGDGANGDFLSRRGLTSSIAILVTFTLLFSAILTFCTRATRPVILGATSIYCGLLVTFFNKSLGAG